MTNGGRHSAAVESAAPLAEPCSSKAVANYFLDIAERDGKTLNPMKLQKLVYIAHGWHLAIRRRPLIRESVEAWKYGPVIADLYHEFKKFGNMPITERATEIKSSRTTRGVSLSASESKNPLLIGTLTIRKTPGDFWTGCGTFIRTLRLFNCPT